MKLQKNLSFYMLGRFISYIGTGIQQIAMPLYILDITHSAIMMGIFSALNLLPNVITLPFAGILGDRKNRKNIMVITDIGRGVLILTLGLLASWNSLNIYILFLIQIFISIMDSIFSASSTAILPELIKEEELMKAMSLRGGSDAISMIIGPSLGGIIYGLWGIKTVFCLNGLSFILSAVSSVLIIYKNANDKEGKITLKSFFIENASVVSFITKNKALNQLFLFCLLINFLVAPFFDIVFPYVLKKCVGFNSEQYGYLISCFTVGILLGNIAIGIYLKSFSTKIVIKVAILLQAAMLFILTFSVYPNFINYLGGHDLKLFIILAIVILLSGLFNSGINTPINVNLQKMVPNEMRARFFAILGVFCQGAVPFGSLIYGFVLGKFAYQYVLLIVTIIFLVACFIFIIKAVAEVYEPQILHSQI
ncbi:MFS transporter [Clostridium carboxidivorans P7]|uniref:Major facilitator superfamily MFS_1 n=1 Tax=Clostridium carboxidivorans P7 TaxID=536227 RepID=C6PPM2_9CLOT|nr:MFS transporter [Clostridium carboxidivorans]AKN30363.1 MFS transporter [Clostridium carboxidivorans P7]EET88752.1 major facilitator superfamily MFS_1 [Clostridium carboxidivorans P7]